jgi:hypothetical protein
VSPKKLLLVLRTIGTADASNAVLIRNRLNETVLHVAAFHTTPLEVIHTIVATNPNVLRVADRREASPVRTLFNSFINSAVSDHSIFASILDADDITTFRTFNATTNDHDRPGSIGHQNHLRQSTDVPFHQFWKKMEYLAVRQFLFANAAASQQNGTSHTTEFEYIDTDGRINEEQRKYILHGVLLELDAPIELIRACLNFFPESATAIDIDGNTPLHVLLQYRPFPPWTTEWKKYRYEVMKQCLQAHPLAASVVNHEQYIPLQVAVLNKIPIHSGIYDQLLKAFPDSIQYHFSSSSMEKHETDMYPYQLAAIHSSTSLQSLNRVYYLLQKQPSLVQVYEGTNERKKAFKRMKAS